MSLCPCGTNEDYEVCCGRYIEKHEVAPTPEKLMRSRYSAYVKGEVTYIGETIKGKAQTYFEEASAREWANANTWLELTILNVSEVKDNKGFVEFIARYQTQGEPFAVHEVSEFSQENGQWYYVDGHPPKVTIKNNSGDKIGRNDLCGCGSGKKYKKCCGKN